MPQNAEGQGKVMKDTSAIYQELIAAKWTPAPQPVEQLPSAVRLILDVEGKTLTRDIVVVPLS